MKLRSTLVSGTALAIACFSFGVSRAAEPTAGAAPRTASATPKAAAARAFDRFKALDGEWTGKSTKGWTETISYHVIAGGTCVKEESFGAHANETMVTMIHPDGDRLLLTHYCVAKNQPRLAATEIADDLSSVTFTFLDATNLPSRDKGHMDKVVFRFLGDDKFTSQWTWYQDGKESWMEEIVHERKASAKPATAARPPTGLAGLAWMAGAWEGVEDENRYEERWSAPAAGSMIGAFRWIAGDTVREHEFIMLEETPDGVFMRTRQFGAEMKPMKDKPFVFRLKDSRDRRATFVEVDTDPPARLVYALGDDGVLKISLFKMKNGEEKELPFTMRRSSGE